MRIKNSFTGRTLLALGLFFSSVQADAQAQPEKINAIYASISGDHAALFVAQDMGLFRKHGLEVNLSYTAGAAQVIQTMMAGENQIATAGGSGVVDADLGGADLVAVAGMVNMPAFYIVVQPEIKSIQELRGKAVGITRFGSSTDFTMRYIIRKAGLEPDKDVPLLQLGGQPELAAAMEGRRIFAAPLTPPALQKALKASGKILVAPKTIGLSFPHVSLVVRKTYLATRRQIVKNFIMGYSEGVAMLHKDKEASKKTLARFHKTDDPEILEATWQYGVDVIERIPNLDPEMFKLVIEERARTRPEAGKFKPEQFFDESLVRELDQEGFFKKLYAR
ncbi:MAG TPA: ABC transporter substrate-binding protein [Candidatus Binatia bacterium]|jgi:NitT/TauT family transport system substrate-binding protein